NQGSNVGNDFGQKNVRNANNVQRIPRTTANSGKTSTVQCYNCNEKDNDFDAEPTYDFDFVIEVKGRQVEHAYYAHDQKLDAFESLITNVQIEVENQRMVNKEMKRKNALITKELETYKERVWVFENKSVNNTNF
ncbi:hypothetical protein Tco_1518292, partial [Tanacetum coccineum]